MQTNYYCPNTTSVVYDHENIANQLEGGSWIPVYSKTSGTVTMNCNYADFAWGDTQDRNHTVVYCPTSSTYQVVNYGSGEARTIPVNLVRSYVKWASDNMMQVQGEWVTYGGGGSYTPEEKARFEKERRIRHLREVIKSRTFPGIHIRTTREPLPPPPDNREMRARETLRTVIGEARWRGFLKNGFIQARGKSGRFYQIFPSHHFTKVYENGILIERLCVVLKGNFPATDSLIVRYLLILNNENEFWRLAVKHGNGSNLISGFPYPRWEPSRSLTEIALAS
jgi:hypothetical protein